VMTGPLKWLFSAAIAAMMVTGCQRSAESGPMAPDFSLQDLSDQKVSLSDFRGKVVLLDFWATWCPPCRMSIPELVKLQDKYRDDGLEILGISLDDPQDELSRYLKEFKEKYKINYRILRFNNKVMQDYFGMESPAIPTMFVIDRDGKIREKIVGFDPKALKRSLARLLD
jgi:cytochrome c biogenesis protein CcmG/thiol:disulfide interchange protein DsbE